MGVDLTIFIGCGYVFPMSKIDLNYDKLYSIAEENDIRIATQDCYGSYKFFDEPCIFIGFEEDCKEIFSAKTGGGFTEISDSYFPFANGGRLPIVSNLDEHSEMDKSIDNRHKLNEVLGEIYNDNEDQFCNSVFYSKWLFSYFH